MSAKNIVICLDGTGNQFKEHNSNVVKLFRVLVREPGTQLAYYHPGVGTLADPAYKTPIAKSINKILGLAFGRGLARNVSQAYSYLMENYVEGDRLLIFGFSRGAYTARVLAGLIRHCGLLEKGCQNLLPYAWKLYKSADFRVSARFKSSLARPCEISLLCLWDSVSTYGWVYDPLHLPWTTNNPDVTAVRHALAVDERRVFFKPLFWGEETADLKEVWFAGVHSDVGGGYEEENSALAKIPLVWMIDEAKRFGLKIEDTQYEKYVLGQKDGAPYKHYVGSSPFGPQHESLNGIWKAVEFLPMLEQSFKDGQETRRLVAPHLGRIRVIPENSKLHVSIRNRLEAGNYHPENLPSRFEYVG